MKTKRILTPKLHRELGKAQNVQRDEIRRLYYQMADALPRLAAALEVADLDAGASPGALLDQHFACCEMLEAMKKLETIVHPMLRSHQLKFLHDAETAGVPVAVLDVPLLYETGGEKRVDAVVVVTTSPEVQRARILARENMTPDKLEAILARQLPDEEKRKRADFVVDTSHGLDPVRQRIGEILREVVRMPKRRIEPR